MSEAKSEAFGDYLRHSPQAAGAFKRATDRGSKFDIGKTKGVWLHLTYLSSLRD
jgi:hypothetical protein